MRNCRILNINDLDAVMEHMRQSFSPEMVEGKDVYSYLLSSTNLSRGVLAENTIVGQLIATQRAGNHDIDRLIIPSDSIYIYDLSVVGGKYGVAAALLTSLLADCYAQHNDVSFHCRSTSYSLVKSDRVKRTGYRIAEDIVLPNFYFAEFGVHEDARHIVLSPR